MNNTILTHKEKYNEAVRIIGLKNLINYLPIKSKEQFDRHLAKDEHLNSCKGEVKLKDWDNTFSIFRSYINQDIRALGINHSMASWVCILKRACNLYYNQEEDTK
jgi:hypothetical protein